MGRTPHRVSVRARLCDRAPELRANQLFPDAKPRLLMHLLLVGISHRTAPVELRERLDFQARGVDVALQALTERRIVREAAVLSTCNRAEIYAVCDDVTATREAVVSFLSQFHGVDRALVNPHEYHVADSEVARHLFRVASGLDSLV